MDDFMFTGKELCTEEQWREFFSTSCWGEFLDTVKARLSITRTELENCEPTLALFHQGEARTLRFYLDFEQVVMAGFKTNRKEQEDERTDNE